VAKVESRGGALQLSEFTDHKSLPFHPPFVTWISAKTGLATPPAELSWGSIFGAGCLSGIGFTMSLFIAALAFGEGTLLSMSKIGIIAASLVAGICGSFILLRQAAKGVSRR
jgi:NhaA family Na+:H+ antiporter